MKFFTLILFLFSFNVLAVPVNINQADAKTIAKSLNGVGIKKAEAIVKFRKANGPYKSIEELAKVKGIGDKTVLKNKADILLSQSGKE